MNMLQWMSWHFGSLYYQSCLFLFCLLIGIQDGKWLYPSIKQLPLLKISALSAHSSRQPPKMLILLVTFHCSFQNWDLKLQPTWLLHSYRARPIIHVPSNITKNISWPSLILCFVEIERSFLWSLIFWDNCNASCIIALCLCRGRMSWIGYIKTGFCWSPWMPGFVEVWCWFLRVSLTALHTIFLSLPLWAVVCTLVQVEGQAKQRAYQLCVISRWKNIHPYSHSTLLNQISLLSY